jgi:hypothetical protein
MLVMPDDTPSHPYQTSVDVAALAPRAESTVYPWRDPPELKARTIERVREFLRAQRPVGGGCPIEFTGGAGATLMVVAFPIGSSHRIFVHEKSDITC